MNIETKNPIAEIIRIVVIIEYDIICVKINTLMNTHSINPA